jgi:acyl carrier protein
MDWFEKLLFEKFKDMPAWVRVFTYLFVLLLYAYLLLAPRYINGTVEFPADSGTFKAYRGADLKVDVDGRTLRFTANEAGYWSIPLISGLPHTVDVDLHMPDQDEWVRVSLTPGAIWKNELGKRPFRLKVNPHAKNPAELVTVAEGGPGNDQGGFAGANFFGMLRPSLVWAGGIVLPQGQSSPPMASSPPKAFKAEPRSESKREAAPLEGDESLRNEIFKAVSAITHRSLEEVSSDTPFAFPTISYFQRIEIISALEGKNNMRIPDEHWKNLKTVGELVQYIRARRILQETVAQGKEAPPDWESVQKMFKGEKPKFRP